MDPSAHIIDIGDIRARLEAGRAEKARRSFRYFVELLYPEYAIQWFHDVLIRELETFGLSRESVRLGISMPPGHAKTTYCALFICWLLTRDRSVQVKYVTYNQERASEVLEDIIKPILMREEYIRHFGHALNQRRVSTDATRGKQNNKKAFGIVGGSGWIQACGFGGGITGGRCDVIVIDDPFKGFSDANSPAEREKKWNEYRGSILSRKRPGRPLRIAMPFTRWHLDDLAGRAQDVEPQRWRWVEFEALREPREFLYPGLVDVDDPRADGEVLWDELWSKEELEEMREASPEIFSALYQQRPIPDGGGLIQEGYFNERWDTILAEPGRWFQSWDFRGGGKKDKGSYAVGLLAFQPDRQPGKVYIVRMVRERWTPKESTDNFAALQHIDPWGRAHAKLVEKKGDGIAILSYSEGIVPGLIEIVPSAQSGNKEHRLRMVQPLIAGGAVILPRKASWLAAFLSELCTFPASANDDIVDALSQLLDYIYGATVIDTESERVREAWNKLMAS